MPDDRPVVRVTRRLPEEVERELSVAFDARLNASDEALTADELREALASADAVVGTVTDRFDAAVLGVRPIRARVLASFGVGVDHVDLDAARAAGLVVTNTPDVLTDCTADLALALLLMTLRRLGEGERQLRAGEWTGWRPTHLMGRRVTGRTLGIVGLGRIGQAVAHRAGAGFGMRLLGYDPRPPEAARLAELGIERCDTLDDLLARADVVSLHCPATEDTRHLIDARRLALMRPDAVLINTARGSVVDEAALARALREGQLAGAGLDVYEREPSVTAALLELERVVLLPHLGSATVETRVAMGRRAVENLRAVLEGRPPRDRVA